LHVFHSQSTTPLPPNQRRPAHPRKCMFVCRGIFACHSLALNHTAYPLTNTDLPTRLLLIAQAGGAIKGDDDEMSQDSTADTANYSDEDEDVDEDVDEDEGEEREVDESEGASAQPEPPYPVPTLRRGAGLFLMAKAIEFDHPYLFDTTSATASSPPTKLLETVDTQSQTHPSASALATTDVVIEGAAMDTPSKHTPSAPLRMRVQVDECNKFKKVYDKAAKGAKWLAENKVHVNTQRVPESSDGVL
jgi:hypothetical protein